MPRPLTQLATSAPWPADAPRPQAIVEAGERDAETLKQDARSTVRRVAFSPSADGGDGRRGDAGSSDDAPRPSESADAMAPLSPGSHWITKTYHLPPAKGFALSLVRASPAWRELRAFARLRRAGLRLPEPIALVGDGRAGRQWLVMPCVNAPALDEVIADPKLEPATRRRIARAVGEQVGRLLRAGLVNRDHKASNLLIDTRCRDLGEPPILIDPLGVRRRDPIRVGRVHRMFARLLETAVKAGGVSKREVAIVLRAAHPEGAWRELRSMRRAIAAAYRAMNGPPL